MTRQMVILAGGMGTRLRSRLGDLPKPMIPIAGKPLLETQIDLAKKFGFRDVLILACYRAEMIQAHFGAGKRWGLKIEYIVEEKPLGTAGAVLAAHAKLSENFVLLYGDTLVNVDLDRIWETHLEKNSDATLLLHPNDHPLDSDLVEVNPEFWITAFHNRPHPAGRWFQNLVNAGLYVVQKKSLSPWAPPAQSMDFGKDLFPAMLKRGLRLFGYNSPEYIKDIGTPERYDRISAEFESGVVGRSSLETPQPAVFLDRDGTLIRDVEGLVRPEQLELLPGVAEAIRSLNHHGLRAVVVTNQPVVAKGFCTEKDVQAAHDKMETLLGREHAFLDRIYYCPHHPERGFPGERPELKIECDCRKPQPGMIERAARDLNLDLKRSWLVGDTTTDLQTARNAGVRPLLVQTGAAGRDGKYPATPEATFASLKEAVQFILEQRPVL